MFTLNFIGYYSIKKNTSWLLISTIHLTGCTDYFDSPCTGLTVIVRRPTVCQIPKIFLSQRYNEFLICNKINRKRQRKVYTICCSRWGNRDDPKSKIFNILVINFIKFWGWIWHQVYKILVSTSYVLSTLTYVTFLSCDELFHGNANSKESTSLLIMYLFSRTV